MPTASALKYVFTLHDPDELLDFSSIPEVRYAVYQEEVAPTTGRYHLQGYIQLYIPRTINQMKELLDSDTVHLERQAKHASNTQAREYCMKDDTRVGGPYEYGTFIEGPGSRSDIKDCYDMIKSGKTDLELAEKHPGDYVRYYKGFDRIRSLITKPRTADKPVEVLILLGATRSGKTRYVNDHYPNAFWKQPRTKWWDGYAGEDTVIIDEFYGWIQYDIMLRICDRYPLLVENKGSQIQFLGRRIVITSNRHPMAYWRSSAILGQLDSFIARCTKFGLVQKYIHAPIGTKVTWFDDYDAFTLAAKAVMPISAFTNTDSHTDLI